MHRIWHWGVIHSSLNSAIGRCNNGYFKVKRQGVCPDGSKIDLGTQTVYRRY